MPFSYSENISADVVKALVDEQVIEGDSIEFKEMLPGYGSNTKWEAHNKISDKARNEILEEIIAFANAHGGTLFLGIKESDELPSKAVEITPIAKCSDLADRLALIIRDCIEPTIPIVYTQGVVIEEDGSGVIVIHLPSSRMAPHRHTINKECFIRRADRSEKMSMREIQDLTLYIDRGLERIENKFKERDFGFIERFNRFKKNVKHAIGLRFTAIPLTDIYIKLRNNEGIHPSNSDHAAKIGDMPLSLGVYQSLTSWRPMLRGIFAKNSTDNTKYEVYAFNDGLIEYQYLTNNKENDPIILYAEWFLGIACNVLETIKKLKIEADAEGVEYALEICLINEGVGIGTRQYGSGFSRQVGHSLSNGVYPFPRYSIADSSVFNSVIQLIELDFWNLFGVNVKEAINVEQWSQ